MSTTPDDDATSWRDLVDQLTPEQVAELEYREAADLEYCERQGIPPEVVVSLQAQLNRARSMAHHNLIQTLCADIASPPVAVGPVHDWQAWEGGGYGRLYVEWTRSVGDMSAEIIGIQHDDGRIDRSICAEGPESATPAQARQLAALLVEAADELDPPRGRCEAASLVGHEGTPPCLRPAVWRVDMHGCRQRVLCEEHLESWKHTQGAAIEAARKLACAHCGRIFESFQLACTITTLNDAAHAEAEETDKLSVTPAEPEAAEWEFPFPTVDDVQDPEPYSAPEVAPTEADTHPLSYSLPGEWDSAIDRWLTRLAAGGATPATRRTRRSHIRSVARELAVDQPRDVSAAQLEAILGRPARSRESRRALRGSLTSFFSWCLEAGIVQTDPAARLPKIRTAVPASRPATDDVWRDLLGVADQRTILMARLACEAGLRRAEVAQVHADDLLETSDGWQLIVHGKGEKQRVVPIAPALAADIRTARPLGGFLFPGKIDGHISPDRVGHLVSKVMPKGWSMHKLRHRFATRAYAATGQLRAVQEILGHTSVATTQRYTAVSGADLRRVSEAAAWSEQATTTDAED
jgi:integrase